MQSNDSASSEPSNPSIISAGEIYVSKSELDSCMAALEAKVETTMIKYQSDIKDTVGNAISEFRADSLTLQTDLEKTTGRFKFWVIGVGVAIVASIIGILLTVNQSQDDAFMAGYETRTSQKAFIEQIENGREIEKQQSSKEMNDLKNQINLLIELNSNDKP